MITKRSYDIACQFANTHEMTIYAIMSKYALLSRGNRKMIVKTLGRSTQVFFYHDGREFMRATFQNTRPKLLDKLYAIAYSD